MLTKKPEKPFILGKVVVAEGLAQLMLASR
jgi:hypothetical protein